MKKAKLPNLLLLTMMLMSHQQIAIAQRAIQIPVPPPGIEPGTLPNLPSNPAAAPINPPGNSPASTTTPAATPTNENDDSEEEGATPEDVEPPEPGEETAPSGIPPGTSAVEQNPLNPAGPSIDRLVREGINADLWQDMKGELPCLEASDECIGRLQAIAVTKNPLLVSLDKSIEEINIRIEEARRQNKRSIQISMLSPAVQYIFQGTGANATNNPAQTRPPGPLDRLFGIFSGITGLNNLLSVVGVPIFQALTGTTPGAETNKIAIADLQVKNAALVKDRAVLANEIKNKVYQEIINFDQAAREFQLSQEIAKRESDRFALIDVEYRLGQGDTNTYLGAITSLDAKKAATYRAWGSVRRYISAVKILVLGTED